MSFASIEARVERALERVVAISLRHALPLLVGTLLLTAASALYVARNIGVNTDTADMLSPKLAWRQTYSAYQQAFPQYIDAIAVVVDGTIPGRVDDAASLLRAHLEARPDLYADVFDLQSEPHFHANQLLYLDGDELARLSDRLATAQPMLGQLAADPTLHGLAELLREAVARSDEDEGLPLAATLARVDATLLAVLEDRPATLSWQELMSDTPASADELRRVIVARPLLDFSEMLPGAAQMADLRAAVAALTAELASVVQVRRTGGAALGYDELQSVAQGSIRASILAFVLITICLVLGLGSWTLVIATQLNLLVGLILTTAFATWAVGDLNLISVAFAALYLGLASAFSIHYALRARELLAMGDKQRALVGAAGHVGSSILLCALATALGFYSFVPTSYQGVAELGVIAGTGMLIGFVLSMTLLPALLWYLPFPPRAPAAQGTLLTRMAHWPVRHAQPVVLFTAIVAIVSAALVPFAGFNQNPIHLQDPTTESVRTFRDLLEQSNRSPYSIAIVANDSAEAAALKARLEALPSVDSVQDIDTFVAADQEPKLALLDDLALTFGNSLDPPRKPTATTPSAQREALRNLRAALQHSSGLPEAVALGATLDRLLARLEVPDTGTLLSRTERALLGDLPGRIARLRDALQPQSFAREDLPEPLRERWVTPDGRMRLEVFPREDLDDNTALERFVSEVRSVAGSRATDTPVVIVEAGRAVVRSFQQAFTLAILTIALLLWFILRDLREVALSLGPLLLASLTACALMIVCGQSFNFANIIALPLLLGIGVDNSLHILHRYRTDLPRDGLVLTTSTARAILFDGLTAIAGFGNLALSRHLGTSSLGVMLAAGLAIMIVYSLVVLPSLLQVLPLRRDPRK
ncbi:MAG: MMPL family transporter [Gammaproteobacteria bacterium]|nr:MMPL family transporter [Gammaproteobacteria bacterium]